MPHTSYDRVPQCPRRRSVHRSVQTINRVYGSVYGSVCDTVWLFLTMAGQPSNSQMQLDSMGTVKCSLSLSKSCHHILFSQSVQTINRMYGLWVRVHATQCGYFSATLLSLPLCRVLLLCLQACNLLEEGGQSLAQSSRAYARCARPRLRQAPCAPSCRRARTVWLTPTKRWTSQAHPRCIHS